MNSTTGAEPTSPSRRGPRELESLRAGAARESTALLLLLGAVAVLLVLNARRRFEFFDMSAFLDAGYRVAIGQRIYCDFFYNAGPIHPYMHALFFRLFGFGQIAILAHLLSVALAVTAASYAIARRMLGAFPAAAAAAFVAVAFYGSISHPWYDQNASYWIVLGILGWEFGHETRFGTWWVPFFCGVLVAFSFLTKANVGVAGCALFAALFAVRPSARLRGFVAYTLGGACGIGIWWAILDCPWGFVEQTLVAYDPFDRLIDLPKLRWVLRATPYTVASAVFAVLVLIGGGSLLRAERERVLLVCGLLLTSLFSAWTGSMMPGANTVWLGFDYLYLLALARSLPESSSRVRRPRAIALALVCLGATHGIYHTVKATVDLETWTWNSHVLVSDYSLRSRGFEGWRANRRIGEGLDRVVDWLDRNVPHDARLFVGPDATMIYGITGRKSFPNAPFIFHAHRLLNEELYHRFRSEFLRHPPDWIVLHLQEWHEVYDMRASAVFRWLRLDEFISRNYRVVWSYGDFVVLCRRGAA